MRDVYIGTKEDCYGSRSFVDAADKRRYDTVYPFYQLPVDVAAMVEEHLPLFATVRSGEYEMNASVNTRDTYTVHKSNGAEVVTLYKVTANEFQTCQFNIAQELRKKLRFIPQKDKDIQVRVPDLKVPIELVFPTHLENSKSIVSVSRTQARTLIKAIDNVIDEIGEPRVQLIGEMTFEDDEETSVQTVRPTELSSSRISFSPGITFYFCNLFIILDLNIEHEIMLESNVGPVNVKVTLTGKDWETDVLKVTWELVDVVAVTEKR